MATIEASGIPLSVEDDKLKQFFTYCGQVKSITTTNKGEKTKTVSVEFASPGAISTALLLNGAELDGQSITVKGDESAGAGFSSDSKGDHTGEVDIGQEDKPKSTIFAEYLAAGYKFNDQMVKKAVDFDKEKGISTRFTNFLKSLDEKYNIHSNTEELKTGAESNISKIHEQANANFDWDKKVEEGKRTLQSYIDAFKKDKYGSKIHDFYKNTAKDAKDVHEEALRLAGLDKQSTTDEKKVDTTVMPQESTAGIASPFVSSIAPQSTTAQAAGAGALETPEKKD